MENLEYSLSELIRVFINLESIQTRPYLKWTDGLLHPFFIGRNKEIWNKAPFLKEFLKMNECYTFQRRRKTMLF